MVDSSRTIWIVDHLWIVSYFEQIYGFCWQLGKSPPHVRKLTVSVTNDIMAVALSVAKLEVYPN